ncbi:ketopantoate reductase family protein [Bacillus sp. DX1.1]|uniref:ketopantoate reductase family protein n=1 Tax=unclassified Bacillus (in: firmicutes) TaxID=185979 RepID=UPI00256FD1FE|nr:MULTISPECIES: ketopantoate reductase family protein [unclassified Bacillus (in: firmicutes)]MDM5155182.1 ketopantoate reductase family protein [Bacillus sp. DX1.1]WJE79507.1 ketopantoate reductase family protein [Bacillus sp. DX3.1]
MRFLIVGAGAIGGYFGGRLAQKGEDVTFLVRSKKQKQLNDEGLTIKSIHGDFHTPVKTIGYEDPVQKYDVIIIAVKSYHLPQVQTDIAPYVGSKTVILPLLNGYEHFEHLQHAFGKETILGGLCFIETTLDEHGTVIQSSPRHDLVFGEWDGTYSDRAKRILSHFHDAGFNVTLSENIQRDIWHKYIFIASMSGVTTLMNAPIGPILSDENGQKIYRRLILEVTSIAKLVGAPVSEEVEEQTFQITLALSPSMKSSMQRDMEKNLSVEAQHLHGFLLAKISPTEENYPILQTVYSRLKIYESML